ncbi:YhdP family protein [Shewanella acanthi]|uniref:YhdP family protein n=1 Tax=Shewanella acanthi TaxID=2864212 RepID=UPI001C66062C|nr:YhdP family protein [Shewanella acanthi]QYJ78461.1 TIGR02099 family protein [Shewanella acanthi]
MATPFTARKLSRVCWQLLAVVLVLFALTVSLIRGLLPQVDEIRHQVVEYVKSEYHIEVKVGGLSAQWQAFGPALSIDNLIIPPQEKIPVTVLVKRVQIKLDFWQSLLTTSARIENVNFDGVRMALDIDKLSAVESTAPDTTQASAKPSQTDWLYRLLLKQLAQFSLTNASLQLLSQQHDYPPILIRHLNWRNSGDSHRGAGELFLDDKASEHESLGLQLDIKGDGANPDSLTGQIYLVAQSLDLGEWSSRQPNPYDPTQKLPLEGVVNLKAWFDVAHRSLSAGLVQFEPSWLQWAMEGEPQTFEVNAGSIAWSPSAKGWQVTSTGLDFKTNGVPWPQLNLAVKQQDKALFGYLSQLDLQLLSPLLPLFPGVDLAVLKQWFLHDPQGLVGPIRVYQTADKPLIANTSVKQLRWQAGNSLPTTNPLDVSLQWQDRSLVFSLPAQDYIMDFHGQFSAPLTLQGEPMKGEFNTLTQSLFVPRIQLENEDVALDAGLKLDFSGEAAMSLSADVIVKNAANADRYFPTKAMGQDLVDYLDGAIKAGNSQNAKVLWQGPFSHFPFHDNSGVFQAAFSLENAEYQFQPDWPAITDLSLDALFENARMDIWVDKGMLMDVVADGAHVFIPELSEKSLLKVEAELATTGPAATKVLQASPLADTVGETLKVVEVQGAVTGRLDLSIPLYEGAAEDIRGQVNFDKTPVAITKPGLQLDAVTGSVTFANQLIEGKGIKARLFNQPLDFSFNTKPSNQGLGLNVKMKSRWDLSRLPEELNNPLQDFYQGKLAWAGDLAMLFNEQGYQIQAKAGSDLVGTQLMLPGAFAKPLDEPRPLNAEFTGDQASSQLKVKLDNLGEFIAGIDAEKGGHFDYYDLLLGRLFTESDVPNTTLGHIQLEMTSAKLANWLPVINAFIDSAASEVPSGILIYEEDVHGAEANEPSLNAAPSVDGNATTVMSDIPNPNVAIPDNSITQKGAGNAESSENITAGDEATAIAASQNPAEVLKQAQVTQQGFFPKLSSIDATIGKFDLLSQGLTELTLKGMPTEQGWRFNATASEFEGTVDFFPDWMTQGLKVTASRFYFSPEVKDEGKAEFGADQVLTNLPPVAVNVDDFRFFDKPFGSLVLQASPQAAGYRIQTLSLTTPDVSLQGNGIWHQQDGQNQTELSVSMTATQFNHLSEQLGIDPGVNEAPLKINAELAWAGAPYAFALESLNGKVKFEMGKGHLSQVSDKGARIFSLFSLDSLVRKLSLDFSDVFGQGMYFNSFNGNLQVDNGVVKTTDTEMDAIAGNMKVRGFTDLTSESLNYDIRFVPQLASSVPTVVLISTSAWTLGIGAFALTKVLEPVIEVISEIRFRVTGTMSDPVVEELERKSKEIEIPESILPIVKGTDLVVPTEEVAPNTDPKAKSGKPQSQVSGQSKLKPDAKLDVKPNPIQSDSPTATPVTDVVSDAPVPEIIDSTIEEERGNVETQDKADQGEKSFFTESITAEESSTTQGLESTTPEIETRTPQVEREPSQILIKPANDESINPSQGESNEHQPTAMSEQSRRQRESAVYRIAA